MNTYKNGNYLVTINPVETGTKIYHALRNGEDFDPEFPDNLDIKLTGKCYQGCPYCHEDSTPGGIHADLRELKKLIENSLPEGVPIELAFGGGNLALMEPYSLGEFFRWVRRRGHIVSVTLNYNGLVESHLLDWRTIVFPYIHSIGISLDNEFMEKDVNYNSSVVNNIINTMVPEGVNKVLHLVLGTFKLNSLEKLLTQPLYDLPSNQRILFLGYKTKGRGGKWKENVPKDWMSEFRRWFVQGINGISSEKWSGRNWNFSFDNLALSQLDLRSGILGRKWKELFMGQENSHSMYIDAVTKTFSPSSTSLSRAPWRNYGESITQYFQMIKQPHDGE